MTDEVETYIGGFPPEVAERLREVRHAALSVIPDASEKVAYGIPTITSGGRNVFHYAAYVGHLSTYPVPEADGELGEWIARRRTGKGTLQHPHSEPLDLDRITEVARLLAEQREP